MVDLTKLMSVHRKLRDIETLKLGLQQMLTDFDVELEKVKAKGAIESVRLGEVCHAISRTSMALSVVVDPGTLKDIIRHVIKTGRLTFDDVLEVTQVELVDE